MRTVPAASLIGFVALVIASIGWGAQANAAPPPGLDVGSCTPELVHPVYPGVLDATGSGSATAAIIEYTDAHGVARPDTSGTVTWSAHAIVKPPQTTGAAPQIGGSLDLQIATAAGDRLTFNATCIAGSGAVPVGMIVYANGLTGGWPGSTSVRRSFVHFEGWRDGGTDYTYAALIDSTDCKLNHDVFVFTPSPYPTGSNTFGGLPAHTVYAETECSRRFGDPYPRSLAPGLNLP